MVTGNRGTRISSTLQASFAAADCSYMCWRSADEEEELHCYQMWGHLLQSLALMSKEHEIFASLTCLVFIIPLSSPLPVQGEWYEEPEHILSKNWIIMRRFPKFFNLSTPTSFPGALRIPFSQLHMPFPQRIYELAFCRQISQSRSKQSVSC